MYSFFFFFNDTATTEIYTLSLHDALPISAGELADGLHLLRRAYAAFHLADLVLGPLAADLGLRAGQRHGEVHRLGEDRKSTRLNSSHANISYAVFCLKKKK